MTAAALVSSRRRGSDVLSPTVPITHRAARRAMQAAQALRWGVVGAVAVVILMRSGCATIYEGKYDWSEGWRIAVVAFEQLHRYEIPQCRDSPLTADKMKASWAVVRYRLGRRTHWAAVAMDRPDPFTVGAPVYVGSSPCARELQPRTVPG